MCSDAMCVEDLLTPFQHFGPGLILRRKLKHQRVFVFVIPDAFDFLHCSGLPSPALVDDTRECSCDNNMAPIQQWVRTAASISPR
eukprot:844267-Prorocentrum_minimum.AAC.2